MLWASSITEGVVAIEPNHYQITPVLTSVQAYNVCSCGSFTWIGTQNGLFRQSNADNHLQKYAEEGIAGFEIPDNIVEQLYCPQHNLLIVVMPEAIAFFPIENGKVATHATHFDFMGQKNNVIYDIIQLPDNDDLLFFTKAGLLFFDKKFIQDEHHEHSSKEVHTTNIKPEAIKILLSESEIWHKGYLDAQKNIWLATHTGKIKRMSLKQLRKEIKKTKAFAPNHHTD